VISVTRFFLPFSFGVHVGDKSSGLNALSLKTRVSHMCVGKLKFTSTLISLGKVGNTKVYKLQYYQQTFEKQISITKKEKQERKIT